MPQPMSTAAQIERAAQSGIRRSMSESAEVGNRGIDHRVGICRLLRPGDQVSKRRGWVIGGLRVCQCSYRS
jgi:hypothetical protein